jgi:FMN phosphatase YigB (HAD superfamily)
MPYVLRNAHGEIQTLHREALTGAEFIAVDDPQLQAWLRGDAAAAQAPTFASLDAGLVRVLEDLVDVLIARNVICVTDLPVEAQQKLFERKGFRDRFQHQSLDLFGNSPGVAGPP